MQSGSSLTPVQKPNFDVLNQTLRNRHPPTLFPWSSSVQGLEHLRRKGPIFQISTVVVFSRISFPRRAKVATRADFRTVCSGQEIEGVGRIGGNTGPGRRRNTNFFTTYTYMYLEYQYSIRFAWAVLCAPQNPTHAVIRSMTLLVLVIVPTLKVKSSQTVGCQSLWLRC